MKKPLPKKPAKPPVDRTLDDRTDTQKDKRARYERLKDMDL